MTDYKKWADIEKSIPEDEEDKAKKKLRDLKDDLSEKEHRRLHDCWREPEFQGMFQEYIEETQDPKHRAETEQYLAQCEAEQRAEEMAKQGFLNGKSSHEFEEDNHMGRPEAPDGQKLLKPEAGYVVKTWKREPGRKDFDREMGKVFVNVCCSEELEEPTATEVEMAEMMRAAAELSST